MSKANRYYDRPGVPRTYRYFHRLRLNNRTYSSFIGKVYGGCLKLLRRDRFNEMYSSWIEYAKESNYSDNEWDEFLANYLVYGVSPDEYHCFHFKELNDNGKREFVTDISRVQIYQRANASEYDYIFNSKYETYKRYMDYFKRDAILISGEKDLGQFNNFIEKHNQFICKPLSLYLGKGISVYNLLDWTDSNELFREILKSGESIIEEIIEQTEEIRSFHPNSLNTVRIRAFRIKNEEVVLNGAFFRVGIADNVVDNAGSGGLFAAIDMSTGIISGCAMDKHGEEYVSHPDTKVCFPGFQMPDWKEAKALCEELMLITPQTRYIGWDLAHTKDGWVVVEGNHTGQFAAHQMVTHSGCAKEIELLMQRMENE